MTTVVLATRNAGKVRELKALLAGQGLDVAGLEAFPQLGEIEETGQTFEDNARLKAAAVSQATGCIALADDSGLAVDALNGGPGVRSARYSGENATDAGNNAKLLEALKDVPEAGRGCRFVSVVVAHAPDGRELVFRGEWPGRVGFAPVGGNGFGYDPLFYDEELGLTAAQMSPEQKNARSHRGQAMAQLAQQLPGFIRGGSVALHEAGEGMAEARKCTRVKGWLKFLSLVMLAGMPFVALRTVVQNISYMKALSGAQEVAPAVAAEVSKGLALEMVLSVAVALALAWSGYQLLKARPGAPFWAQLAWLALPLSGGVQYVAAHFWEYPPEIRDMAIQKEMAETLPGLFAATASIYYLKLSKRVKAIFGD